MRPLNFKIITNFMGSYSISDIKNDLTGAIHGASLNKIKNITDLFNRAARQFLQDIDAQETIRIQQITNALYDNIYDYSVPTDLKGNKVIDIRPQALRTAADNIDGRSSKTFDRRKTTGTFHISHNEGVKFLRISKDLNEGILITSANSLTDNGTWALGGDGTNLTLDQQNFLTGGASLNFDLDGSGTTGFIQNPDFSAIDLSAHEDISSLFVFQYLPNASAITNLILTWGDSSAVNWARTVTAQHFGAFVTGWNLLRFDWNGAAKNGSPDSKNVVFARVAITYDGVADTDFRLDSIISKLGSIQNMEYYSKFLFRTAGGTWQEKTTLDTDLLNLDTDSYNVYFTKVAELTSQQLPDYLDVQYWKNEYERNRNFYQSTYPSEVIRTKTVYYRDPIVRGAHRGGRFGIHYHHI